jgi:hypothetical protein
MEKLPLPEPPYGMLKIVKGNHSKFTGVFLNDHFMGHVGEYDNSFQGQLLKAGEYQLKVVSPEGQTIHEEKISIKDNQTTVVKLKKGGFHPACRVCGLSGVPKPQTDWSVLQFLYARMGANSPCPLSLVERLPH